MTDAFAFLLLQNILIEASLEEYGDFIDLVAMGEGLLGWTKVAVNFDVLMLGFELDGGV